MHANHVKYDTISLLLNEKLTSYFLFYLCSVISHFPFLLISFRLFGRTSAITFTINVMSTWSRTIGAGQQNEMEVKHARAREKENMNFHLKLVGEQQISRSIPFNPNCNLKIIIILVKNSEIKFLRHSQFCCFFLLVLFASFISSSMRCTHFSSSFCSTEPRFLSHVCLYGCFVFINEKNKWFLCIYVLVSV